MPTCEYGTRVKSTSPDAIYVSENNARDYAGAAATWLSPILALFQTRLITTASLCASVPVDPSPWELSDLLNIPAAAEKLDAKVLAYLWATYCECVPNNAECGPEGSGCAHYYGKTIGTTYVVPDGPNWRATNGSGSWVLFADGVQQPGTYDGYRVDFDYPVSEGGSQAEGVYYTTVRRSSLSLSPQYYQTGAIVHIWLCPEANCTEAAPTQPAAAESAPTQPDGVPDAPELDDCSVVSVCERVQMILADLQHVFAALSRLRSDVLTDTTTIIGDTTALLGDVSAVKSDTEALLTDINAVKGDTEAIIATQVTHGEKLDDILDALAELTNTGLSAGTGVAVANSAEVLLPEGCRAVLLALTTTPAYLGAVFADPDRRELGDLAYGRLNAYNPTAPIEFELSLFWPLPDGTDRVSYRLTPGVSGTLTPYTPTV